MSSLFNGNSSPPLQACSPAIIVHGGAWKLPDHMHVPSLDGVKRAAVRGYLKLLSEQSDRNSDAAVVSESEYSHSPNAVNSPTYRLSAEKPNSKSDGLCLDAVELAVREMETDPTFDAGRGSCLTSDGTVEMDSAVMSCCHGLNKPKGGMCRRRCPC